MPDTPEVAMEKLLHDLFDADEFRVFLRRLEGGDSLQAALVGKTSTTVLLFSEAVGALKRRGEIDDAFFAKLVEERPKRKGEIDRIGGIWLPKASAPPIEKAPEAVPSTAEQTVFASTPAVPVFLSDGRDGYLSDVRWRQRKGSGTIDLVALVYDPEYQLLGPVEGTVIGTCSRPEPKRWRFTSMSVPTQTGDTSGDSSSLDEARVSLVRVLAKIAPSIAKIIVDPNGGSKTEPMQQFPPARCVKVLTKEGAKNMPDAEVHVGEVWWWCADTQFYGLVARFYRGPHRLLCLEEEKRFARQGNPHDDLGIVVWARDAWRWKATLGGEDEKAAETATDEADARERLFDAVDAFVPGIRDLVLPAEPPPVIPETKLF